MLVLSRKVEQDILIGDAIRLRVCAIRGKIVRIGIEAPKDLKILRGELAVPAAQPAEGGAACST